MGNSSTMKIISARDAVHLVRDTLKRVDPRLVDHGERVAYILMKMLADDPRYTRRELESICILGIFHDIGAYKTDEIDKLVQFETVDVWDHSIYGYLFLKHMSPLSKLAEAVLYHHYDYRLFGEGVSACRDAALLIGLADRVDVLLSDHDEEFALQALNRMSGRKFDPAHVDMFLLANEQHDIIAHLRDGSYMSDLFDMADSFDLSQTDIDQYLRMLIFSIDFRSTYTVAHTINTVSFSVNIARMMGCTESEITKIYYGALLHDIGKITTPLEILESSGKLDSASMAIMKTHVEVSEEIICGIVDDEVCKIAVRHHEKLDGSGYPRGLTGDCLTRSERIVAVADIVSALVGERSYKEAFPLEKVFSVIAQMKLQGKLCPDVCDVVLTRYDELSAGVKSEVQEILSTYSNMMVEFRELYEKLTGKPGGEFYPSKTGAALTV